MVKKKSSKKSNKKSKKSEKSRKNIKKKDVLENSKKEESIGSESKDPKKEVEQYNRILRNVLIGVGVIVLIIIIGYFIVQSLYTINVEGVKFEVVRFCDSGPCLTTYNTKLPIIHNGQETNYNFYLRNDPRALMNTVPFNGTLNLRGNAFFTITFNQHCRGYESIAVENLVTLYEVSGVNLYSGNQNLTCAQSGGSNFMFVNLKEGNETRIDQTGPSCYDITIESCEILEGTERFMVETLIEINDDLNA